MRKRILKLVALCWCLVLASCTGSFETRLPTLLIIGYGETEGNLALVRDVRTPGSGIVNYELIDVVDDLPGEVLAYDITDRNDVRSELVVLTQNDEELFVSIFEIDNLVFDGEGAALELDRDINLSAVVAEVNEDEPLIVDDDPNDETDEPILQISEDGRYLALLSESDDGIKARLSVFDIEANRNTAVELLNDIDGIENDVLFLDQDAQRLYFLQDEADGQNLIYLDMNDLDEEEERFEDVDTRYFVPDSRSVTGSVRDINKLGQTLIALQQEQFVTISTSTIPFTTAREFETIDNAEAFLPLDTTQETPLILYGDDELAFYRTLTDEAEIADQTTLLAGSVQSGEGFIYFLTDEASPLAVFDLQSYLRDPSQELDSFDLVSFRVQNAEGAEVALPEPVFIEWTKAVIESE